jgi:O-antigen/teichoic acid export membrane protein
MLKSALLILSGQAFSSLLLLLRNLFVARLISVENYGIAATFAISMAIVEMMTTLGLHQMIIQDSEGDDPRLQSGLQGFHLLRSLFSGTVLFFLAEPIAQLLGVPDIVWAYQLLALVPVINGLMHFDLYRLQRRMVYLPSILSSAVPALASVLVIWPLWKLYGDYRVMLYSVMLQAALTVVTSHLVAKRRYHLSLDKSVIARSLRFGWPLLINNILLFFIFQGEKIIVGEALGLKDLAIFAMGFTLTLTPSLLLAGSTQTFFLPQLSAIKEDRSRFDHLAMVTFQSHLFFGALFVVGVMLLADPAIRLVLSAKYASLIPLMTWLAILQALRLFRGGSSTIALAMGKTGLSTISNLPRVFSMPIAWYAATHTGNIFVVLWIAIIGEGVGFLISLFLLRRQLKLQLGPIALPISLVTTLVGFIAIQAWLTNGSAEHMILSPWTGIPIVVLFTLALISMKDLRQYVARRKTGLPFA